MAQFAIDEILTTGIAISGFIFDVSNSIGVNNYVLTSTSSGVMWQQDSSNTDLAALSGQIIATGALLNNRINSLSGYVNGTFISGSGIQNYVPRWNSARELITGSIYDLGTTVGIGTTSPAARLQISKIGDNGSNGFVDYGILTVSSGYATQATLGAEVIGDGYSNLNLGSNIGGVRTFWHISKRLSTASTPHSLEYFYYDGSTFNQRFTFTPAGNLGIGTVIPVSKLTVQGDINVNHNSASTNYIYRAFAVGHAAANRGAILRFGIDDGGFAGMSVENIASSNPSFNSQFIDFKTHEGGVSIDTRMRITPSGYVGIGTISPISILSVGGAGVTTAANGITFGADSSANLYRSAAGALKTDASLGIGINPVQKLQVEGVVGNPASIGTTQSGIFRISNTTDNAVLDFGIRGGGLGAWIQSTDETSLAANYPLLLNPNGASVGIGTTIPTYQLTVIGANQATANLTDAGAKGGSILVGSSVNAVDQGGAVLFATKNDANLYTPQFAIKSLFQNGMGSGIGDLAFSSRLATGDVNLSEVVRIKYDGKVGIGTNNPFTKLHVYAASNGNNWAWFAGNVGATVPSQFTYGLLLGTNYSNGFSETNLVWGHGISSNQYFAIGKASGNASYTEQLRIDRNGNVGIGTNITPLKLNVSGSIYMAAGSGSAISWANDISSQFLKYDSVTDGMVLSSWSHTTFLTQQTERVRIASNGNVGIGVTNPTTLLQLKGDAGSHQIFSINRSGSTTPAVYIGTDGNQNALIASNNTNLLFGKDFVGTFNEYVRIASNGRVGIGFQTPTELLDVSGRIRAIGEAFTLNAATLTDSQTSIALSRLGAVTDQKYWEILSYNAAANGDFAIRAINDAYSAAAEGLRFVRGGSYNISSVLLPNGNIGIGTATLNSFINSNTIYFRPNPSGKFLNIYSSNNESIVNLISNNSGDGSGIGGIYFTRSRGQTDAHLQVAAIKAIQGGTNGTLAGGRLYFYTKSNGGGTLETDPAMIIDTAGNIGIGTTVPSSKLTIYDHTNGATVNLVGRGTDDTAVINFRTSGDLSTYAYVAPDTNEFRLYHNDGFMSLYPGGSEKVRFTAAGNVGIGVTNPGVRLQVTNTGSITSTSTIRIVGATGNGAGSQIEFFKGTSQKFSIGTASAITGGLSDDLLLTTLNPSSIILTAGLSGLAIFKTDGKVGIGMYDPVSLLSVGGAGSTSAASGLTFGQDAQANLYRSAEDTIKTDGNLNVVGAATLGPTNINGGTLGASPVNIALTGFTYAVNNGNISQLTFVEKRFATGGDWTTATTRIQKRVDVTDQAYIEFNPSGALYGMALGVAAGGSLEAMRILSNGRIGIGTTNPSAKLSLNKGSKYQFLALDIANNDQKYAIYVDQDNNDSSSFSVWDATNSHTAIRYLPSSAGYWQLYTNNIERVRIDSAGNVGVGTTSMVGKLDVYDNTDGPLLSFVRNASAGSSAYSAFVLRRDGNNNGIVLFTNSSARSTDGGAGNSTIRTDYGNLNFGAGGSQHILTTGGNVGINNTSPSSKLHVVETTPTGTRIQLGTNTENASMNAGLTNDLLILNAPYGTNSATVSNSGAKWGIKFIGTLEANQFNSTRKTSAIYAVSEDPTAGYNRGTSLAFYTNSWFDQEYTERMRIFHNGNIGIGTTQPSYKLQIVGSGTPTSPTVLQVAGLNDAGGDAKLIIAQSPVASDLQLLVAGTDARSDGLNANDQYILAGQQLNLFNRGNGSTYNTQIMIGRDGGYGNISFSTAPQNQTAVVRMYIASGGNVGIGSISPACKLDVAGTIRSSSSEIYGFGASDNVSLRAASSLNVLGIYTSNVERLRLAANGYFGIGTDNPSTLLSIGRAGSTTAASGITFGEDAQANLYRTAEDTLRTDGALIAGTYLRSLNYVQLLTNLFPDSYTDYLKLNVGNAAGNAWENYPVVIKRGVYVGIGTDVPSGKLHVVSTVAGETVLRADGTNGTLFSVVDDLSDSLMSVNNSAGLPVLEVFADDRVVAGQYGSGDFVIRNNKVGIGATNPLNKLSVIGAASIGSTSYNIAAPTNGLLVEGNVGIGTTNPAGTYGKLVVAGGIRTLDDNNSKLELGRYSAGASNSYIKLGSNSNSLRITNNTDAADIFTILNEGSVGIGTTGPSTALHIVKNSDSNGLIRLQNLNATGYSNIQFHNNAGVFQASFGYINSSVGGGIGNKILLDSVGSDIVLRGANVGIGVTNPSQLLHISSTATAKLKITADTDNVDENDLGGIEISQDGGVTTSYFGHDNLNHLVLGVNSTTGPNIYIGTRTDGTSFVSSSDAKVTILNGGNVGINTTAPTNTLQVVGQIAIRGDESADNAKIYIQASDNSNRYTVETDLDANTNNDLLIFRSNTVDNMIVLKGNGNVGIGTTNPSGKLSVDSVGANSFNVCDSFSSNVRVSVGTINTAGTTYGLIQTYQHNTNSAGVSPLNIQPFGGNVGIGLTVPTDKIQISGGGISFTSSTGLAVPMLGVTALNVAYVGPYNTPTDGNAPSTVLFNHGASVQQTWFYSSGSVAMVLNRQGRLHIGNLNNTPNSLLSVGPTSSTTAVSGMCFGNDASANLYRSAASTVKTDGNLNVAGTLTVAGTTSLNGHIYGQKTVTLSTASWTTVLTVNMLSHNSCYVKIGAFGDWSNHSAIAFVSELFIQNGDNAYNTPGTIITAHDNTGGAAGDKVDIQIVDPAAAGTQNFLIQLKLISATSSTNSSLITYHVMGQQASVT